MSFVTAQPAALATTAGALDALGSAMSTSNAAAKAATSGVLPAAGDEVSALTATQFAAHAALYQLVSVEATRIHELFVETLAAGARSYAATDAANAAAAA